MRIILTTSLLLCCFTSIFSQQIKGVITDTTGKPLPYASVYIRETGRGTNANSEGRYVLTVPRGTCTVVCQYVGYLKQEIKLDGNAIAGDIDFRLRIQEMTLGEVVIGTGEDPAYEIIRSAIKLRKHYRSLLEKFQCEVYTKGQMRVRNYPDKFLGKKVDFEDGDTSKQKMVFLSETISRYSVDRPDKVKIEVLSSRVSGQSDGYGLAAPNFMSFYDNNIFIGNSLNPRGFISPISDNALNYYKYKFEGSFIEDGKEIDRIRVTPRRKFEPLFSGTINIVADEWRIHSVQLLLTKSSQMQTLDTLRIEQLHRPLNKDTWYVGSQVIYPAIKIFGFDVHGSFVNIYSDFDVNPSFDKKYFNNTILKYTDSSNKKTADYWNERRPLPLMQEEVSDYRRKDSLELVRKDPRYLDSLDKRRNKISPAGILLLGQTFTKSKKRSSVTVPALLEQVNFNPAEALVINTGFSWVKRLDSASASRRSIEIAPTFRYAFGIQRFSPSVQFRYTFGKKYLSSLTLAGGRKVFQFNNGSPIGERGNTLSCLLSEENRIKTYDATFFRAAVRRGIGEGFNFSASVQYQDRTPLDNISDYTWRDKADRTYTPNFPNEIIPVNISHHQAVQFTVGIQWQAGTKYVELPGRKINIGSKYPVLAFQYTQGIPGLLGSDVDFSKWKFTVSDNINLKLRGLFRYRLGAGGFIRRNQVQLPDYTHFNGNLSSLAAEYLNSFQLLPIYQFSNTERFYALGHVEYNLRGFLTNKIPGFRKLNFYLVTSANAVRLSKDNFYYEASVGFDNILKQLRIDFVQSWLNGKPWQNGFKIGLSAFQRNDD